MEENSPNMESERRPLRADAERNRRRLLDAATAIFCERGLDVGVGEIAERAGVGRGTLFRNFPSKEHLIAAIVVERMHESVQRGRAALDAPDPGEALFELIEQAVGIQQTDRALFDALDDEWLANDDIRRAHTELMGVLDTLVRRAQEASAVRADVSAVDVMMMVKGACESSRSLRQFDSNLAARQLDLVRAAISTPGAQRPLRGRRPTIEDLERVHALPGEPASPRLATG
jgi:AcrR family transcriptional regulator